MKTSAVRVALVERWAQVWTRKPSALAKMPVTSSAPQTVQPCGTARVRDARGSPSTREGDEQLEQREGERVVERRVALEQDDLEREDRGGAEDEQVAAGRAAVHAGEHGEPEDVASATPPHAPGADAEPEAAEGEQRGEDDVHAGDEARARDARPLEPEGLQAVAAREQRAGQRRRQHAAAARAAATRRAANGASDEHGDPEPEREEREERVDGDRILDLDERQPPDRGDRRRGRSEPARKR